MQRKKSTMTAAELQDWRERNDHTLITGSEALGVSHAQFSNYLGGQCYIPRTVALLVEALNTIDNLERYGTRKRRRTS